MMATLKFIAPLIMAGAAATTIAAAPIAAAESFAVATGTPSITIPASPGGDGCANGVCGNGGAGGGGGGGAHRSFRRGGAPGGGGGGPRRRGGAPRGPG